MEILQFWDSVFKGIGVVQFFDSSIAGIIFLVGLAIYSRRLALFAFLGSLVSTLTGMALGASDALISTGFFGFNGVLTATALWLFLKPTKWTPIYALFGACLSSIVFAAIAVFMSPVGLPALTAPFVLTTWVFLLSAKTSFKRITPSVGWWERWPTYGAENRMEPAEFIKAVLRGNAQVMFSDSWITGAIFIVGYTLGGIRYYWPYGPNFGLPPLTPGTGGPFLLGGVIGFVGSLCGTLMAWAGGADIQSIKHGIYGFNGTLCAIAISAGALPGFKLFPAMSPATIIFGIIAAAVSSLVLAFMMEFLNPYTMPALTWPFIITTWCFLLAAKMFPNTFHFV